MKYRTFYHGLLVVDKPKGLSSMDVVRRVRRAAGHCKTGHAGTLDPLATGVLVCCLGKATKLVGGLMDGRKTYDTTVDLSAFTQTDDLEGEREEVAVATPPTREQILAVLPSFTGQIEQRPPLYSAVHINGQRAYKLARKGEDVELPTRTVTVHAIELLSYDWPSVSLRIKCGKGTYIRSLGRDLGKALNTGGHLTALRRTAVGRFTLDEAVPIERLDEPITQDDLIPLPEA